jgi:predicted outer membrane repeat protein
VFVSVFFLLEVLAMTQWFVQRFAQGLFRRRPASQRPQSFRPRLEVLEDRTVPSTLKVTNLNDSGAGSLRAQIAAANPGDNIVFNDSLSGTITLTSGELDITSDLRINGPGADTITVSGNNHQRVFHTLQGTDVSISGLTIANGSVSDFGAGIESEGSLTLHDCTVTGNHATLGGGVTFVASDSSSASLTVQNCTFTNNSGGNGGGLLTNIDISDGSAQATVRDTTFSNNFAQNGGGIYTTLTNTGSGAAVETLSNVQVDQNTTGAEGGGLWADVETQGVGSAILQVRDSDVSNNTSGTVPVGFFFDGAGGGVRVSVGTSAAGSASAVFEDDTIAGNSNHGFFGGGFGGGLSTGNGANSSGVHSTGSGDATLSIRESTFSGNSTSGPGGAIAIIGKNSGSGATNVLLSDDIVSGNTSFANGGGIYLEMDTIDSFSAGTPNFPTGQATATLDDMTITNNTSEFFNGGGGLATNISGTGLQTASVSISDSQITDNTAGGFSGSFGGGINAMMQSGDGGTALLNVDRSTISGNQAASQGGGIYVQESAFGGFFTLPPGSTTQTLVNVSESTVANNTAGFEGGGLYLNVNANFFAPSTVSVALDASTVANNSLTSFNGFGGGIFAQESGGTGSTTTVQLTNSTVFGNSANHSGSLGGGIYNLVSNPAGTTGLSLLSSTVAFNSSTGGGGVVSSIGLFEFGPGVSVRSSIIADNTAIFGAGPDVFGDFASGGHNLIGDTDAGTGFGGTDLTGNGFSGLLDPMFGTFGDHGGPTETLSVLAGSPAIGNGDPNGPATDQRGVERSDIAPTIGAFEFTD